MTNAIGLGCKRIVSYKNGLLKSQVWQRRLHVMFTNSHTIIIHFLYDILILLCFI